MADRALSRGLFLALVALACLCGSTVAQQAPPYEQHYAAWLDGRLRQKPADPKALTPGLSATNVPVDVTLQADALGARVADVYLGTVNPPPLVKAGVAVVGTTITYKPTAPLAADKPHYWKLVVRNGSLGSANTLTGPVWTFKTGIAAVPTTVTVTPASTSVDVGQSVTLTAAILDQAGHPMAGTVTWSATPTTGIVNLPPPNGMTVAVAGLGAGTATVTATSGALQGSSVVTVTVPQPPATGTLDYLGKLRDGVQQTGTPGADGQLDGTFGVKLAGTKPLASLRLTAGTNLWATSPGGWCAGVATDTSSPMAPLINASNCAISYTPTGAVFWLLASDSGNTLFSPGRVFTLEAAATDGSAETLTATIPSGGPPTCDAPCVKDPTRVEYTASPGHATVTAYTFVAEAAGAPTLIKPLGVPVPDSVAGCGQPTPCISVALTAADVAVLALNTLYTATITATNADGTDISIASNTFMRTK